jgi:hypothetical protein
MPPDDGFAKHTRYLSFARNYCVYVWRDPIPAPEQHESAYLLPENAAGVGVVFGI